MNRGLSGFIVALISLYLLLAMYLTLRTVVRVRGKHLGLWDVFFPLKSKLKNLLQLLLILFSLIYSVSVLANGGNRCPQGWQWHFGLFAIILGWTYLIFLSYKLPWIGVYAITFMSIVLTFFKLAFFAALLILASTIILKMVFFDPTAQVSQKENYRWCR